MEKKGITKTFLYNTINFCLTVNSTDVDVDTSELVDCDQGWVFNHDTYGETIIEKLGLVCENGNKRKVLDVAVMVGMLIGAISFGQISDR